MNAKNFAGDALRDAIDKCRAHNVRTNITLNTLVHTKEMRDVLTYVEELYTLGCDALIVADLGAARLIHRYFPDLELHASTQAAGHNIAAAEELAKLGFSRMVAARELSFSDLSSLCEHSPIETELFIHGAICVSQSGQCLASSLIGGRSGNRGECAQPC
ncbi:MAG: U32 family peptidase, partial [Ruminococcaceae bacterium]|nr:U32 family peptidase [Oscillospiraceae bacterium]